MLAEEYLISRGLSSCCKCARRLIVTVSWVVPWAEDPQLAEFLQLMQPRRAGAIWSNEDASLAPAAPALKGPKGPRKGAQQDGTAHEGAAPAKEAAAMPGSGKKEQKDLQKKGVKTKENGAVSKKKLSKGRKEGEQVAPIV